MHYIASVCDCKEKISHIAYHISFTVFVMIIVMIVRGVVLWDEKQTIKSTRRGIVANIKNVNAASTGIQSGTAQKQALNFRKRPDNTCTKKRPGLKWPERSARL